jgi:hypothetical protein
MCRMDDSLLLPNVRTLLFKSLPFIGKVTASSEITVIPGKGTSP